MIPTALCALVKSDDSSSSQQKREGSTKSLGACKKMTVKNNWPNSCWAKRTGENFNVFSARKAYVLLLNESSVCLKFHIFDA